MHMDPVRLAETHPKAAIFARRLRTALTGKPYFFNGQRARTQVFRAISERVRFDHYVETGTFLGMTTHFLACTARTHGADVYSCELNERYFAIARGTVGNLHNVHLRHANSVDFLRSLLPRFASTLNFVYLDAHWYDYLPLRDELGILMKWQNTIVMIDDFRVPADNRFGWDKYDEEREISLQYIADSIGDKPVYFPAYPAQHEGNVPPRGYCVLATSTALREMLDGIALLERHDRN